MDKPSLPKGTRDFGPAQMAKRQLILDTIKQVFSRYGFMPLETPSMENLTTLSGKYGEEGDQMLFRILNSGDYLKDVSAESLQSRNTKAITAEITEKGLRYDLTVPFARYVVMNRHEIALPFKRYQVQPVWRADRPQKGRYREFYQCDADVVGTDSLLCEAEIILMIQEVFSTLQIDRFTVKMNHRGILAGLAEITDSKNESALFVAIDKLEKIGEAKVRDELAEKGFDRTGRDKVFEVLKFKGSSQQKLQFLDERFKDSPKGQKGISDIREVYALLQSYGASDANLEFDVSLARGLSYYTGCIFEVKVHDVAIGSVSGGGRYDNLTQAFGSKEKLSGVGISFGIDRLYDSMEELKLFPSDTTRTSTVLICHFDKPSMTHGLGLLRSIRDKGVAAEIYPDQKKIDKQLDYANQKKIPFAVIIGSEELSKNVYALKDLRTGVQQKLDLSGIISTLVRDNKTLSA